MINNKQKQVISSFHIKLTKYDLYTHLSDNLQVHEQHNNFAQGVNTSQYNRSVAI
jgi:hypothetical protein